MDNCRMNRSCGRMPSQSSPQNARCSSCRRDSTPRTAPDTSIYHHLDDHFPPAMGYVPFQKWSKTFELCRGLQLGTIFPELCKPFCGKGGAVCR